MKPKAFSYIRFSTPQQEWGNSRERQLSAAREYAAAKGLDLDESEAYRDEGVSAFDGLNYRKGGLAAFIAACDEGRVPPGSFLLVENLDRLSRLKPTEAVPQLQEILRRGVTVVTLFDRAEYPPNALDDTPKFIMSILTMQRAHEESALKSERVGKAWASKRRRAAQEGKPMTRMCPAWLVVRDDRFEVLEDRAEIVREIFALTLAGNGKGQIAKTLNARGVAPFGRSANGWHPSSVQKVLESEAVIGVYQPHRTAKAESGKRTRVPEGDPIRSYFPPIIDEATFLRAQAVRADRRIAVGRKGARLSNLFTGLVRCGHCGGPMHFDNKGDGHTRLTCGDVKRGAEAHAPNSWRYPVAERFTVLALREVLDVAGIFPAAQADALRAALRQTEGELLSLHEKIKRDDQTIGRLLDMRLEDPSSVAIRERLRAAEAEKADDGRRVTALEDALTVTRASIAEGERDRTGVEDALQQWAALSEGSDEAEAYRVRLALQQLLKRTVASVELLRTHDTTDHGTIHVTLKSGTKLSLILTDQNAEGEMRAGVAGFLPERNGVSEMGTWEEVEVPAWWPKGQSRGRG